MVEYPPRHIVIVGATASGKSSVAIDVAYERSIDIVSLDSMQIYQGMEIGTGVVPIDRRHGVKHHMISIIPPTAHHTVKHFQQEVYDLLNTRKTDSFVFAGGTGLYTHAIIDGFKFAPTDEALREAVIEKYGLDENNPDPTKVAIAYERLKEIDPVGSVKIDPLNIRRIVRSLEAYEISGKRFSDVGSGVQTFNKPKLDVVMIGLRYSRDTLRERITERVDEMFESGWIEEVKSLLPIWDSMVAPARNAIGYQPIKRWIEAGSHNSDLDDLKVAIVNRTAQFSRRQRKWFERDPRITWIDCDEIGPGALIEKIKNLLDQHI